MNDFIECITKMINADIASGMTPVEALIKAGAKKLDGCDSIYHIAYGLYEDKALFFNLPEKAAIS